MSFNVWYGGVSIDPGQIDRGDRGRPAPTSSASRSRRATCGGSPRPPGCPYVDESLHLISRYPLFAAGFGGRALRLRRDRSRRTSSRSPTCTCSAVRTGRTWPPPARPPTTCSSSSAALGCRRSSPTHETLGKLGDEGVPTFLTGDFNSPSHLDWTEDAVDGARSRLSARVAGVEGARRRGFRDSYRDAHADPAAEPGLTWTAGQPPPRMRPARDQRPDRLGDGRRAVGDARQRGSSARTAGPTSRSGSRPGAPTTAPSPRRFAVEPARRRSWSPPTPRVVERGERVTLRYMLAGGGAGAQGRDPRRRRGPRRGQAAADDPDLRRLRPHRADVRHRGACARRLPGPSVAEQRSERRPGMTCPTAGMTLSPPARRLTRSSTDRTRPGRTPARAHRRWGRP